MSLNNSTAATMLYRIVLTDIALLMAACLIPTISHLFALPLYQLNPMLLVLLASMLLVSDNRNAYLMAVLLPVVSMLMVGMPTPAKCLCMIAEYGVVVTGMQWVMRKEHYGVCAGGSLIALLGGKMAYYAIKSLLVPSAGLVGSPDALISTPIILQIVPLLAVALVMPLLTKRHSLGDF